MRKVLIAMLVVPALALAQGTGRGAAQAGRVGAEQLEKRMRLTRTLGLAEALDLDTAQALKLGDTLAKFDSRREAARKQAADAYDALRGAAMGGKASAADVDGAMARLLDARAQLQAIDREMLQTVTKDLSPEKKARAALFLGRFRQRIERHMWAGHGHHDGMGAGMGGGMGAGMQGRMMNRSARGSDDGIEEPPPFADEE